MQKAFRKLGVFALLGLSLSGTFGCAYGGIAAAPDGSIYIARNDLLLLGLLRKVFVCKPPAPGMPGLVCTEAGSP